MRSLLNLLVVAMSIILFVSCDLENKVKPELDETTDMDSIAGTDEETADERTDEQTTDADLTEEKCEGCIIDSICYPDGVANPANPCKKCDSSSNETGWTNDDEAVCDDGKFCTENDTCSAGSCEGTVVDPDDGVACNGVESCDEENGEITVDKSSGKCEEDQTCDVNSGLCVENCAGCGIDGVCYGAGQINPLNICEKCDIETSRTQWSNNDGKSCDDGKFCTENDTCSAGNCEGTVVDPDDGVACNGVESCDEENDEITVDTTSGMCSDDQICDVEGNSCIDECPGCFIDGICYGDAQMNPENVCSKCDITAARDEWTNLADNTVCDDGKFCTENDKCTSGTCGGTDIDPDDKIACNGVESCDEENDVIISTGNQCGGDEVCDISSGECVEICPGCVIESICYADKQMNPADPCSFCDIEETRTEWTDGFGTADNGKCSCDEGFEGRACTKKICAILVSPDGDDAEDGSSWTTAVKTIQIAVQKAVVNECDIWVKEGTYAESVDLLDNIKVYGSFKGDETAPNERVIPQVEFEGRMVPDPTTIIDGQNTNTPLKCLLSSGCGDNVLLDGLAIMNGRNAEKGGGMINNQTSPTIQNCLFKNNAAKEGGVMYNESASVVIINTRFSSNQSYDGATNQDAYNAGAIYNNGSSLFFDNCVFDSNRAGNGGNGSKGYDNAGNPYAGNGYPGKNGGKGGVFYNKNSTASFKECLFYSNNAGNGGRGGNGGNYGYVKGGDGGRGGLGGDGGIIYGENSEAVFVNTALLSNTSGRGGDGGNGGSGGTGGNGGNGGDAGNGGIFYNGSSSSVVLINCLVSDTVAGNGGNGGSRGTSYSSTLGISGVGGDGGSGAVYLLQAEAVFSNSTVVNAATGSGGTGRIPGADGQGGWISSHGVSALTVSNSILWTGDLYADADTTAIIAYSDVEAGCASFANIQCGEGNLDIDPVFENVTEGDYRLKDTSPCIDFGSNDLIPADVLDMDDDNDKSEKIPFDLSGMERVQYSRVDMGAYEKELVDPYITTLNVVSSTEIELLFNEEVDQTTAEDSANYAIDNGVAVAVAVLDPVLKNKVTLTVAGFGQNDDHILTINNVTDISGNPVAADSAKEFSIAEFRPVIETVEVLSSASVKVIFDKELDETTSQITSNYVVESLTVDSANLELTEKKEVTLNFTPDISSEVTYSVIVNGVLSSFGFEIVADSSASFSNSLNN